MFDYKSWDEFGEAGLLWFVNSILHCFGWAIVVEEGVARPARTPLRGFDQAIEDVSRRNLSEHLRDTAAGNHQVAYPDDGGR